VKWLVLSVYLEAAQCHNSISGACKHSADVALE